MRAMFLFRCTLLALFFAVMTKPVVAWDNHAAITKLSLESYRKWPESVYQPLDQALIAMKAQAGGVAKAKYCEISSPADLVNFLKINGDKVNWSWKASAALEVLAYSSQEVDFGMDQNLNLNADQAYMGGYTGLSSQGFRHMYYRAWTFDAPLVTFHFPPREMGSAVERVQTYFELAELARKANQLFWSYRFLGWGLHYVEDLGQPYHTTQFASFRLLPVGALLTKGWKAFMDEATRIVGNFHLSFEDYVSAKVHADEPADKDPFLTSFAVPLGDEAFKLRMAGDMNLSVSQGAKLLAKTSSERASGLASIEDKLVGEKLRRPGVDLRVAPAQGAKPVLPTDWDEALSNPKNTELSKELQKLIVSSLSDVGVAVRWYIDRLHAVPATQ